MYGGPQLRPYVVEFIRGTGVRVNGVVVQDSGGNGPFSWVLPDDVAFIHQLELVSGGVGGQGGGDIASPQSLAGGGGGVSGCYRKWRDVLVVPGSTLTVTVGAGGTAGAVNGNGGGTSGETTVAGVLPGGSFNEATTLRVSQSGMFYFAAGASASAVDTVGGGESAAGTDGENNISPRSDTDLGDGSRYYVTDGAHGGGGRASGAAGGNGGARGYGFASQDAGASNAAGTNVGGISRGGGGQGGNTPFGRGGNGGSNSAGENATNYGAGGGGGAGGFAGGAGGPGYARFVYWSAR